MIQVTWDAFGVVSFAALVFGILYLTLVRFFAKPVVWISILLVWLGFIAAGVLALLYASQCLDADLLQSAEQTVNLLQNATGLGTSSSPSSCEELGGYVVQSLGWIQRRCMTILLTMKPYYALSIPLGVT